MLDVDTLLAAWQDTNKQLTKQQPSINEQHTPSTHPTTITSSNLTLSEDIEPGEIEWIIDSLFDRGRLHMICGPAASGRTRFLLRLIADWSQGIPVMGRTTHPSSFLYCSGGRDRRSIKVALRSLNINPENFSMLSGLDNSFNFESFLAQLTTSQAEVIFIDNLALLCGIDPTDSLSAKLLKRFKSWAEQYNKTIIFTHPMVKTEVGNKYPSLKSKIAGNTSWISMAESIILIDEENPQFPQDPFRKVELIAKNYKLFLPTHRFKLDDEGRLQAAPSELNTPDTKQDEDKNKDARILKLMTKGQQYSTQDIITLTTYPRATVYRTLDTLRKRGLITKGQGQWSRV